MTEKLATGHHAAAYLVAEVLARGATVLLTIWLTYVLAPEVYGTWAVLTGAVVLLGLLLSTMFASAAARWYFLVSSSEFRRLFFTLALLQVALVTVAAVLLDAYVGDRIASIFPRLDWSIDGRLLLVAAALSSIPQLPVVSLQVQGRSWASASLSFLAAGAPVAGMALGAWIAPTLRSVLWGLVAGQGTVAVVAILVSARLSTPRLTFNLLPAVVRYGMPLVPHLSAHWLLGSADRFMLSTLADAAKAGSYHLAYMVGFGIQLFGASVNKGWLPQYLEDRKRLEAKPVTKTGPDSHVTLRKQMRRSATSVATLCVTTGSLAALWGDQVLALVVPRKFVGSLNDVLIIGIGNVLACLYLIPVGVLVFHRATGQIAVIAVVAAVANICLNWLWIPHWGTTGAAWATLVSYSLLLTAMVIAASRFETVPIAKDSWRRYGVLAALLLLATLPSLTDTDLLASLVARTAASLGVIGLMVRSGELRDVLDTMLLTSRPKRDTLTLQKTARTGEE